MKPEFKLKVAEWEVRKALAGHSNKVSIGLMIYVSYACPSTSINILHVDNRRNNKVDARRFQQETKGMGTDQRRKTKSQVN